MKPVEKSNGGTPGPGNGGARSCPVCSKPTARDFRPFCSRRCADVDLSRWLSDVYVIEGPPLATERGEEDEF
jgi:hypothetical protein